MLSLVKLRTYILIKNKYMENILKLLEWPTVGLILGIVFFLLFKRPLSTAISRVSSISKEGINIERRLADNYSNSSESQHTSLENFECFSKHRMSELLQSKLSDGSTKTIQIFCYTNEVEAGSINKHKVKGEKVIEIYKRSILSDLREQQRHNIEIIAQGANVRFWDKKSKSLYASKSLEKEFSHNLSVDIREYHYGGAPVKRAYVFDGKEAVISYYKIKDDLLKEGGSRYKGMENSENVHITDKTSIGRLILGELRHYSKSIQINGRSWQEESSLLKGSASPPPDLAMPCLELKAVYLDSQP